MNTIIISLILIYFFLFSSFCSLLTLKIGKEEMKQKENQTFAFKFIYYYGYGFIISFPIISIILFVLLSLLSF